LVIISRIAIDSPSLELSPIPAIPLRDELIGRAQDLESVRREPAPPKRETVGPLALQLVHQARCGTRTGAASRLRRLEERVAAGRVPELTRSGTRERPGTR
jgi:hypothetical protein